MTNLRTINRPHATGFSLLELLVVISIIAVIASLLIGGVSMLKSSSKESQARTLLANLMGQASMYEVKTRQDSPPLNHIDDDLFGDWSGGNWAKNAPGVNGTGPIVEGYDKDDTSDNTDYSPKGKENYYYMRQANAYIERFIWAANQMPQIREKLDSLGAALDDSDNDGFLDVVDPWGNPIAYAASVSHDPTKNPDDDFLPVHNNPFFASAGADLKWGLARKRGEFANDNDWLAFQETDAYKDSLDNLYSFDLDRAAATRGD